MRLMWCTVLSLATTVLLVVPTARAQTSRHVVKAEANSAIVQEIRVLNDRWQNAIDTRNVDQSVAMYGPNAVFMAPNAPKASGAAIRSAWAGMFRTPGMSLKIRPVSITPSEDGTMAYDVGMYEFRSRTPQGRTATDKGKYLVVWTKANGQWKVAADMFNSDLPAAK
jgi:ketosteroid isomerase-like protein